MYEKRRWLNVKWLWLFEENLRDIKCVREKSALNSEGRGRSCHDLSDCFLSLFFRKKVTQKIVRCKSLRVQRTGSAWGG